MRIFLGLVDAALAVGLGVVTGLYINAMKTVAIAATMGF